MEKNKKYLADGPIAVGALKTKTITGEQRKS